MNATPDLDEIHVLQEALSRVSQLTSSITHQTDELQEETMKARKALVPQAHKSENFGSFKDNLTALLKQFSEVEDIARRVHELQLIIDSDVNDVGLQKYVSSVVKTFQLSKELRTRPQYENFKALLASSRKIYQEGVGKLVLLLGKYAKAVFAPTKIVDTSFKGFDVEDLEALKQLIGSVDQFRGTEESVNMQMTDSLENFYSQSMNPMKLQISQSGNSNMLQLYMDSSAKLVLEVCLALAILFKSNENRLRLLEEFLNLIHQKDTSDLQKQSKRVSQGFKNIQNRDSQSPRTSLSTPKSSSAKQGPIISPVQLDGKIQISPANSAGQNLSKSQQPQQIQSQPQPQAPSTTQKSKTETPLPNSPSVSSFPNSEASSIGQKSRTKQSSQPPQGTSVWPLFQLFETAQHSAVSEEELNANKQQCIAVLTQQFEEIPANCRKGHITNEYAVNGASMILMKTIKSVAENSRGVDILLSELPTRVYITKPMPQWAVNSDPTPAARANPLSLYFCDLMECYYQTLHLVAVEHLRERPRVGSFMLTNLTAVEHFVTDSKTDTLETLEKKSELMQIMGQVAVSRLQRLIQVSFKEYLTNWAKLAPYLMEATVTSNQSQGKLSSKDREIVKEKFRNFNSEFEELLEQQKNASVADPVLRQRMSQEVKKLLRALYFRFYDKHCSGDFTKNIGKYIKWNKEEFDRALEF